MCGKKKQISDSVDDVFLRFGHILVTQGELGFFFFFQLASLHRGVFACGCGRSRVWLVKMVVWGCGRGEAGNGR